MPYSIKDFAYVTKDCSDFFTFIESSTESVINICKLIYTSIIVFIVITFLHEGPQLPFLSSSLFQMAGLNYCFYHHHFFTWRGSIIVFIVITLSHGGAQLLFLFSSHFHRAELNYCFYRHFQMANSKIVFIVITVLHEGPQLLFYHHHPFTW